MDIDRFWQMIDQARTAAGPVADQAIRDFDDTDPDQDYWDVGDLAKEWIADQLAEMTGDDATSPAEAEENDEADGADSDDEDDITDPVALALYELLTRLPAAEIGLFDNIFEDVRARADTVTLANAAQLIEHGFLGDDSFDDFRAGLVALGSSTFEAAVANPDSLADHPLVREIAAAKDPRWLGREDMIFVASHAYAAVTGEPEITFFDFAEALRANPDQEEEHADEDDWTISDEVRTRRQLPRLSEMFYARSIRNRERMVSQLGLQG
jgi:Protein of unknown function (DUF4240)